MSTAIQRKYTLDEIDRMRSLVESKYLFGTFRTFGADRGGFSRSYNETEKVKCIEEELRTYMLAGLGPDDLVDE